MKNCFVPTVLESVSTIWKWDDTENEKTQSWNIWKMKKANSQQQPQRIRLHTKNKNMGLICACILIYLSFSSISICITFNYILSFKCKHKYVKYSISTFHAFLLLKLIPIGFWNWFISNKNDRIKNRICFDLEFINKAHWQWTL